MLPDPINDFVALVGGQLLIFSLHMWKNTYPLNMYLLAAFTLLESCMVAGVCAHYEVITRNGASLTKPSKLNPKPQASNPPPSEPLKPTPYTPSTKLNPEP